MEPDPEKAELPVSQSQQLTGDDGSKRFGIPTSHGASSSTSRRSGPSSGSESTTRSANLDSRQDTDIQRLNPEKPGPWVLQRHKRGLLVEIKKPERNFVSKLCSQYLKNWTKSPCGTAPEDPNADGNDRRFRVNFAELQRMQLRKLQCALVRDVIKMRHSNEESEGWEKTLHEYASLVQALRDYDYMSTSSQQLTDPFLATGERFADHRVLLRTMHSVSKDLYDLELDTIPSVEAWKGKEDRAPIGGTRHVNQLRSKSKLFWTRVGTAAIGGAFLIGPMWLMVLHRSRYTALVSTTVCVILFGLTMACWLDDERDVLSSTAAYAAVLVVFVGVSL